MNIQWKWFADRLKEPSTYAGLGVLLGVLGFNVPEPTVAAAAQVLMALAGFAGIFLTDKTS